jgi:hypothetical protein
MSDNIADVTMHTLCIKNENGEWVEIPVFYQTVYNCYKDYCVEHNMSVLTVDAFYNVFSMLADSGFINTLLEQFQNQDVIPISLGGTGASTAEGARTNLGVASATDLQNAINTINVLNYNHNIMQTDINAMQATLGSLSNINLNRLGVTWGEQAPGEDTPGTLYFKIITE